MEIVQVKTSELVPYERNAKEHPQEQVEHIANSIKAFGFRSPIVAWKDGTIINGHGRLLAAYKLGLEEVPVIYADDLTEEEANAFRLADNKTAESSWDEFLLADELADLFDFGMERFGFDMFEEEEPGEIVEDDFSEDVKSRVKLGDVWQLGDHRLICGDSTDSAVIDRLMDGVKADMVFTDPPYGVAYTGGMKIENGKIESNGKKQIKNDSLDYEGLYQFLYKAFINLKRFSREKAPLYIFYAHSRSREFLNAFADAGLKQRSIIIWHKTSGGFGDFMAQYMNAYEPCIYGSNGNAVDWYGASNEKTVWDMDKEKKCDLHPTMKPIELVARAIRNSSKKDDSVLDLFGGSGSTLIACEQLNRKCYMCELDPHYCDVIINRWEKFTGNSAELIS